MTPSNDGPSYPQHPETRLVTAGRDTKGQTGFVNPAVFHGSTVLDPTAEDLHAHRAEFAYGDGSPTTRALQDVLMSVEGPQGAGGDDRDYRHPALGAERRRSCAGDRRRPPAVAPFLPQPQGLISSVVLRR